ncbi:unnamed protein product [Darwinula stevensoni]|uniref:Kinase n=1 Tax=Darwinula stevensoni TaxID=69355 RepID=A0A7R8WXV6_9CRUS|nr:unnamed protein product [Darwinula stevensoni]CAG0878658.1 unnamed protein product [Darwinula stevensoni]
MERDSESCLGETLEDHDQAEEEEEEEEEERNTCRDDRSPSLCSSCGGLLPDSPPDGFMRQLLLASKMDSDPVSVVGGSKSKTDLCRTDSTESTSSIIARIPDACHCEECLLGISDMLSGQNLSVSVIVTVNGSGQTRPRYYPKKPSGWRKVRNIVQLAPFFQTYRKQRYPWVQLAGHQGNFKAGEEQGTILKKLCGEEDVCLQQLRSDALRPYVPEYRGQILGDDCEQYLVLQDLLAGFTNPCVMDCKIGVRTYLEEELAKAKEKGKLRKDMYEKMCQIDPSAPSEEEHRAKGISKPRYMVWRETMSSTATLGFRIEGIKKSDGSSSQDFKMTKTKEKILEVFTFFLEGYPQAASKYLQRLRDISATLEVSEFFQSHELIGSSLLFVHDAQDAKIWLIDFAKTFPVPDGMKINHRDAWMVGNHEDGYLIGLESLIQVFTELFQAQAPHETQSTHR